jgi:hypothetical protein
VAKILADTKVEYFNENNKESGDSVVSGVRKVLKLKMPV